MMDFSQTSGFQTIEVIDDLETDSTFAVVRRLLAVALIDKIKEVDAGDWDTLEKYLGKIKELIKPVTPS